MIGPADHVGIAVRNLEAALGTYGRLGFNLESTEELPGQGVRIAFLVAGPIQLELLESLRADGVIGRFLERRGEGLHHIAFRTEDIRSEMARLGREGFDLVDREPRPGARGRTVAFLDPRSVHGVLLELVGARPGPDGPARPGSRDGPQRD